MTAVSFSKIWSKIKPYFLIIVIGLTLYGRTVFFDFSYLDDNALILDNHYILSDVRNVGLVLSSDVFFSTDRNYYRPLLNLSLMLDTAIGGTNPLVFHLCNILLHLLASILVFLLFKKIGSNKNLSLFLALIFLVHPALTQAVAWIPGRNDSLLAIMVLGAWLSVLSFFSRPRLASYLFYLGLFWLALLTKETAIVLPILVAFYAVISRPVNFWRTERWLLAVGSGVIIFFWLIMRQLALGINSPGVIKVFLSILSNIEGVLLYIGKLLLPFNLGVFPILADSSLFYGILSLVILLTFILTSRQRFSARIYFGIAWFGLFLLPSFVRLVGLPDFLEHRAYLSFVGFLIIISEIDWVKRIDWRRKIVIVIAGCIIISLSLLSFYHSSDFRNRLTFWQAAVKISPHSPMSQRNLGVMHYFQKDFELAIEHYKIAISLNEREPMVHNNLGVIYLEQKRYEEAEKEFLLELAVNPNYDKALFNLGESYYFRGQETEAAHFWQEALAVNPSHVEARQRLLIWQNQIQ